MALFEQKSLESPEKELFLQANLLRAATNEAVTFNNLLKTDTRQVSSEQQDAMIQAYTRFFVLYARAAGNITPKFHLMRHALGQVCKYGSPKYFATYVDEAFNGVLASIAKTCHKLTWAESVFWKLSAIQQLDAQKFAGFRKSK